MADEKNEAAADDTEPVVDDAAADVAGEPTDDGAATEVDAAEPEAVDAGSDESESDGADEDEDEAPAAPVSAAKAKADAVIAERVAKSADRTVTRRVVTSKRVTPKAGAKVETSSTPSKARNAKVTETIQARYTPPTPTYAKGPSPWYVPALMFGLLIIGALIIMTNYMGVFGDAANIRLVLGLAFILGGIVTATQYR